MFHDQAYFIAAVAYALFVCAAAFIAIFFADRLPKRGR